MKCPECKAKGTAMKPNADGTVMFYVCESCGWTKELSEIEHERLSAQLKSHVPNRQHNQSSGT